MLNEAEKLLVQLESKENALLERLKMTTQKQDKSRETLLQAIAAT